MFLAELREELKFRELDLRNSFHRYEDLYMNWLDGNDVIIYISLLISTFTFLTRMQYSNLKYLTSCLTSDDAARLSLLSWWVHVSVQLTPVKLTLLL